MNDDHSPTGGVTPHLVIRDGRGQEAVDFYTRAFGAELLNGQTEEDGPRYMHAHLRLNGDSLMLHDDFPEYNDGQKAAAPSGVVVHLQVGDADAWWQRAIDAGAEVRFPLDDQFWGARYGQLTDPFGHVWSIGGPIPDEGA